jgi:hypothetical protein
MGIVNLAETTAAGEVVVLGMPPSRQWPRRNEAFVIILLFPTELILQEDTLENLEQTNQIWTSEKIWIQWPATQSRYRKKPRPYKGLDLLNLDL